MAIEQKACTCCGNAFYRRRRDSQTQWDGRTFCSILCANRNKKNRTPAEERFWNHVVKRSEKVCWNWTGGFDDKGYGTISNGARKSPLKAHRLSWEIHFGPIPKGLNVCHACDNRSCVNPMHLLLGTQTANALDMSRKGRMNSESFLNLRPGHSGCHGAGPISVKEKINGFSK